MIFAKSLAEQGVEPPLQAKPVAVLARMTLPAVALIFTVPVASAVGSATPLAPPDACFTRKYPPGAIEPERATTAFAAKFPVPVALAYWPDKPLSETAVSLRL